MTQVNWLPGEFGVLDLGEKILREVVLSIDCVNAHSHRTLHDIFERWRFSARSFRGDGEVSFSSSEEGSLVVVELDGQLHRHLLRLLLDSGQCVRKNPTPVSEDNRTPETKDLTLKELETADAIVELGRNAVEMLKSFGTATFVLDEQMKVRIANPLHVYIDERVAHPPPGVEPKYVRPILTAGKPQYVAKKPDGSLWEVEYPVLETVEDESASPEEKHVR